MEHRDRLEDQSNVISMPMTTTDICERLAALHPDVHRVLREHLADYDVLLPYVFLADVYRHYESTGQVDMQVAEVLESGLRDGDADVQDLISIAFVEYISTEDELNALLGPFEAPFLRAEWSRQHRS